MIEDYRDLVISDLADENAALRKHFVALLADLADENFLLWRLYQAEYLSRIFGDAAIERLQRRLHLPVAADPVAESDADGDR